MKQVASIDSRQVRTHRPLFLAAQTADDEPMPMPTPPPATDPVRSTSIIQYKAADLEPDCRMQVGFLFPPLNFRTISSGVR